jgi:CheY-like chemotaxis protein
VLGFISGPFLGPTREDMPAPSVLTHLGPADGATQLKDLGLLAGRKLLLADDSVTIQKVIELTFADEGVRVIAFNNGLDAIEHLEEVSPDIVLADVFMPSKSGYEVCEYVKQNEKLKAIPVMLLVGSFEPFDEAEARRVGADDILTKPFQSIRRLIDRVGALVSNPPAAEKEIPTAELPRTEDQSEDDSPRLNTEELEITTADTMPLTEELKETLEFPQPALANETKTGEHKMETVSAEVNQHSEIDSSDVLLDLGEFEPAHAAAEDDFVLDLDMTDIEVDDVPSVESPVSVGGAPEPMRAFVEPMVTESVTSSVGFSYQPEVTAPSYSGAEEIAYEDQVHEVAEAPEQVYQAKPEQHYQAEPEPVRIEAEHPLTSSMSSSFVSPGDLSPEMIDAIARRVVEMMSDKVVREIAWDVVPDLAELLIKRQLEDKESQPK